MDFLSRFLRKSPAREMFASLTMGSAAIENASGEQSPNKKDKTLTKSVEQNLSTNDNNPIADESSDSSLDYDSAKEDNSPRDDIPGVAPAYKNLNRNETEKLDKDLYPSLVPTAETKLINKPKQKVFNILTESFETPDSSLLSESQDTINHIDSCEIGEDALNNDANTTITLPVENIPNNDSPNTIPPSINTCRGSEEGNLDISLQDMSNMQISEESFSNPGKEIDDRYERESSIEVLVEDENEQILYENSLKGMSVSLKIEGNVLPEDVLCVKNNSLPFNFHNGQLILGIQDDVTNKGFNKAEIEFCENRRMSDDDNISNKRRDSDASIFVINSDNLSDGINCEIQENIDCDNKITSEEYHVPVATDNTNQNLDNELKLLNLNDQNKIIESKMNITMEISSPNLVERSETDLNTSINAKIITNDQLSSVSSENIALEIKNLSGTPEMFNPMQVGNDNFVTNQETPNKNELNSTNGLEKTSVDYSTNISKESCPNDDLLRNLSQENVILKEAGVEIPVENVTNIINEQCQLQNPPLELRSINTQHVENLGDNSFCEPMDCDDSFTISNLLKTSTNIEKEIKIEDNISPNTEIAESKHLNSFKTSEELTDSMDKGFNPFATKNMLRDSMDQETIQMMLENTKENNINKNSDHQIDEVSTESYNHEENGKMLGNDNNFVSKDLKSLQGKKNLESVSIESRNTLINMVNLASDFETKTVSEEINVENHAVREGSEENQEKKSDDKENLSKDSNLKENPSKDLDLNENHSIITDSKEIDVIEKNSNENNVIDNNIKENHVISTESRENYAIDNDSKKNDALKNNSNENNVIDNNIKENHVVSTESRENYAINNDSKENHEMNADSSKTHILPKNINNESTSLEVLTPDTNFSVNIPSTRLDNCSEELPLIHNLNHLEDSIVIKMKNEEKIKEFLCESIQNVQRNQNTSQENEICPSAISSDIKSDCLNIIATEKIVIPSTETEKKMNSIEIELNTDEKFNELNLKSEEEKPAYQDDMIDSTQLDDTVDVSSSSTDSLEKVVESKIDRTLPIHNKATQLTANDQDTPKRIFDHLSKRESITLSPMSKCGDLIGLSPVNQSSKKHYPATETIVENDFLTGNQTESKDLINTTMDMDVDDDDFKVPDELFKDPSAFEYLLSRGNGPNAKSVVPTRDFGKESLFVKFDPLVKLPQGIRPGRETQARTETCQSQLEVDTSSLAESILDQSKTLGTMSSVDQNSTLSMNQPSAASVPAISHNVHASTQLVDKPTQVVTPAISARQQQYQSFNTPNKTSATVPVSPAIAVIDRLINLGLNSPPPPPPVVKPKEPEMDPQLLNELQSVRELLSTQENELKQANETIANLKQQLAESSEREQSLLERVNEKNKNTRQMSVVMEEYERTMSTLISDREVEKRQWLEERANLIRERDEVSSHLANIELSFNDTHVKYERCKTVIQTYKTNEDILKQTVAKQEENLKKQMERYDQLRQHAMSQLEKANQEIDTVKRSSQAEIIKYQAMLKKSEIQISSLQESLAQKTKNCEELTSICDDLINKVG